MDIKSIKPEQQVTWLYETRAGYGYVIPVPATVVKVTNKGRVCIDADLKAGGTKRRYVKPENLQAKEPVAQVLTVTAAEREQIEGVAPFLNG